MCFIDHYFDVNVKIRRHCYILSVFKFHYYWKWIEMCIESHTINNSIALYTISFMDIEIYN